MNRGIRIAALVFLWLMPLCIFSVAFSRDWVSTWRALGVPAMVPHFLDLDSIPAGVETMQNGGDPLVANPADSLHRPTNYPRIWVYLFSAARITRANVSIVALLFCGLYLACVSALIVQARRAIEMVILVVAALSLAPLLAMERGNNDLLVFVVVFLGCIATKPNLRSGALGIAALLKICPMAAMMLDTLRRPPRQRQIAMLLAALVIVLLALQWRDFSLIRRGTPASRDLSYGALSLEVEVLHDAHELGFSTGVGWIIVLECWIAGALAAAYGWKKSWEGGADANPMYLELFTAFGAMYAFTYAIGSNWDYRLIFLVPTLPYVLEMARSSSHRAWAATYIGLVTLAENTVGFAQDGGTLAGHLATFALFLMVLASLSGQSKKYLLKSEAREIVGVRLAG